jgi:DMSO/TMAO reductase YedYZ molybdopterin-dependent catalytic subunit
VNKPVLNKPVLSRPSGSKRHFLRRSVAGLGALMLAGCDRVAGTPWFAQAARLSEDLSRTVHRGLQGRKALAQEFTDADVSPSFRSNGTANPANDEYQKLLAGQFVNWSLKVDGLVEKPLSLTLAQLRALPSRTQITRHDCVEGWSAIGKWTGVPLHELLALAKPTQAARYAVFHCADPMEADGTKPYYESIDMDDAHHAQTLLAYALNGAPLPVANGAPLRLRVERQLGYKQAKYLMRIEFVDRYEKIRGGRGGYWEDVAGYQWYAGI